MTQRALGRPVSVASCRIAAFVPALGRAQGEGTVMKPRVFLGLMLLAAAVLLPGVGMAAAPPDPTILQRLAALEARVAALETELAAITSSQVMVLNNYLTFPTDARGPLLRFSGLNVQLINGAGNTDTINGLGNLIIGYDGSRTSSDTNEKSGSHYLVVGDRQNYSQYGGIVVGYHNTSNGPYASVSGGEGNTASGRDASVSGGNSNTANGASASVSGGFQRSATGPHHWVAGELTKDQ
jgi:hypothetical protein